MKQTSRPDELFRNEKSEREIFLFVLFLAPGYKSVLTHESMGVFGCSLSGDHYENFTARRQLGSYKYLHSIETTVVW